MRLPFSRSIRTGRGLFLAAAIALQGVSAAPSAQTFDQPRLLRVAVLRTRAHTAEEFLLRGTVPIPGGVFPRPDGLNPFVILDHDGTPRLTQVEIVSRAPSGAEGADVVELLARVHVPPGAGPGATLEYDVALLQDPQPAPPGPYLQVPGVVRDLLRDPNGIEIIAIDCFGNRYVTRPLATSDFDTLRDGPMHKELRTHQIMLPEPAGSSTLPHFMGVHAYFSWYRRSTTFGLDLRFHNAHDGHDTLDSRDDPLGTIYFERIEISMPSSWVLLQDFPDPLFGKERIEGGRRIVQLVDALPDGKKHVMRWQGQFNRRLALAPAQPEARDEARAMLDGRGRAFCSPGQGEVGALWSWWNRETAHYFPQRGQLPSLEHLGRRALQMQLGGQLDFLTERMASGMGTGNYPVASGRLGWGHPYGVSYGGMTGGQEIVCWDGVEAAYLGAPVGFRLYSLQHRMHTDRMPNALYQLDGEPSSVDEWRIDNGAFYYVPFEHYGVPLISGNRQEPFGVRAAPTFQVDFVRANGLRPAYEQQHFAYDPHDLQHLVRYTRSAKVLAWLANDSLAKDDLRLQAESFHLSFHTDANSGDGGVQGSGMRAMQNYVRSFPGKGCPFGRGEAWGLDCASAAYSLSGDEWRARKLPWFQDQAEMLLAAQASCSGFIQALVSPKALDGRYQARQQIEQSITEHALLGLNRSVFRGADLPRSLMVRRVLVNSLRAFISEMAWFPGQPGPWRYTAVGPVNPALPVWCLRAEMPSDGWTDGDIEAYQDWSSFAYGYEFTKETEFLTYARDQIGAPSFADLVQRLLDSGTGNLGNRAALIALVQRLTGRL